MRLRGSMSVDKEELTIGGVPVSQLVEAYQTPLYVFDQADFKERAQLFLNKFQSNKFQTRVIYASKAFSNLYISGLAADLSLHIDVVSAGELYTVLRAGYDPQKIYMHGNNKSPEELSYAIKEDVGTIIVDNQHEANLIEEIAKDQGKKVRVLLRVNPSIVADTHKYIQTTNDDSKFGMSTRDPQIKPFIQSLIDSPQIDFAGIHCHIGSQVLKKTFFFEEAHVIVAFAKDVSQDLGIEIQEINLGGGFGVYYTKTDTPPDYASFLPEYIAEIEKQLDEYDLSVATISIEPGRALINDSGTTLYTAGTTKETLDGLPLVFVDGSMADNPRVALYEAEYEAGLANKMNSPIAGRYRIAGKACESGDILNYDVALPEVEPGDIIAVPGTGAYNYSMASNYNRLRKPAVVFVEDGQMHLAVKGEDFADLVRNDLPYEKE